MIRYFYCYWVGLDATKFAAGANVICCPREFDFYYAHKTLEQINGQACMISHFQEITWEQARQYNRYCDEILDPKARRKHLRLIK